jgi:hypothetical protein
VTDGCTRAPVIVATGTVVHRDLPMNVRRPLTVVAGVVASIAVAASGMEMPEDV